MTHPLLIGGFIGYGDNLYKRPFIHHALHNLGREVFIRTAWPSAFYDFMAHPRFHICKQTNRPRMPAAHFRAMNSPAFKSWWSPLPIEYQQIRLMYTARGVRRHGNFLSCFEQQWQRHGLSLDGLDYNTIRFGEPHPAWARQVVITSSEVVCGSAFAVCDVVH